MNALENPYGIFRTLCEVEAERDLYGDIKLRAGNSAAVFTYRSGGERRFLKCYVRPNPRLREIYRYIAANRPALLPDVRLLEDELYVYTLSGAAAWCDVVEGMWTEGETLDMAVSRAARSGDTGSLQRLTRAFDSMCRELLAEDWAHGDLKPENIVVSEEGGLTLIDCDAVWAPPFAGGRAAETGTPGYRHPARDASHFDKRIDDYSMLLISASLHALSRDPSLFARYNTADNIIFSPPELVGGISAAFSEISGLFSRLGMAGKLRMLEACGSVYPEISNVEGYFSQLSFTPTENPGSFVRRGKWGFADGSEKILIEPFWDEVLDFRGGFAATRLGEWWHIMGPDGKLILRGLTAAEMKSHLAACRNPNQELEIYADTMR